MYIIAIEPDDTCPFCKSGNVTFAFGYNYCPDCFEQWDLDDLDDDPESEYEYGSDDEPGFVQVETGRWEPWSGLNPD
jgi:hypothetical protein